LSFLGITLPFYSVFFYEIGILFCGVSAMIAYKNHPFNSKEQSDDGEQSYKGIAPYYPLEKKIED
jgi:hypothetical protein